MQSPLHFAARTGKKEVVEKILEKEANEKNPKGQLISKANFKVFI